MILNIASLWATFSKTFYTEPLMIGLNILFIWVAVKYGLGENKFRVLLYYGIAALLQDISSFIVILTEFTPLDMGQFGLKVLEAITIIFIQIEFFAFYTFFYLQFKGKPMQNRIKIVGIIYLTLTATSSAYLIFFVSLQTLQEFSGYLSVVSSLLQIIPAFYYFYNLFKDPPVKNLLRDATFWTATGIAFFSGLNIPLFLIENYIMDHFTPIWITLYTINYIAYCFLFMLFTIGLVCDESLKIQTRKSITMDIRQTYY